MCIQNSEYWPRSVFIYNACSIQDISHYTWLMDSGQGGSWQGILSYFVCPEASQASIWSTGYCTICSITFNRGQYTVYRGSKSPALAGDLPHYSSFRSYLPLSHFSLASFHYNANRQRIRPFCLHA